MEMEQLNINKAVFKKATSFVLRWQWCKQINDRTWEKGYFCITEKSVDEAPFHNGSRLLVAL